MTNTGDVLTGKPCYVLDDDELEYCRDLAASRDGARDGVGWADGGADSVSKHVMGVIGEYAVAQMTGWEMDTEIYEDGTGDDGYDFEEAGLTFDVKACSPRFADDLLVPEHTLDRREPADKYISVAVVPSVGAVWIVGVADADDVFDRDARRFPAETPNFVVSASELSVPTVSA